MTPLESAEPATGTPSRRIFLSATGSTILVSTLPFLGHEARAQASDAGQIPRITPFDFGAKGDGSTDDSEACNAAAARAQVMGGWLVFPTGVFAISRYIVVRAGVRGVIGEGGVIKCINTKGEAGVLLAGRASGNSFNVRQCTVRGLRIDCNLVESGTTLAIYGQNISECEISDNHIFNLANGTGILLRSFANGMEESTLNVVRGNRIEAAIDRAPRGAGIEIDANLDSGESKTSALDFWRRTFRPLVAKWPTRNHRIISNSVMGGYYGISLGAAQDCEITNNTLSNNARCVSMQNSCTGNLVSANTCLESLSSGIHLAYGSSRNRIIGNRIETRRARGEGLLQAYVGSSDNLFEDNLTLVGPDAAPKYHIYTGVQADRNRFVGNRLSGPCARAYIAVESAFNSSSRDPSHRNFGLDRSADFFASHGMEGVVIQGNRIEGSSKVPAIYLGQISDERGNYTLTACVVTGNTVATDAPSSFLKLVEQTAGALSGLVLSDNHFPVGTTKSKFTLPRGRAHFREIDASSLNFVQ